MARFFGWLFAALALASIAWDVWRGPWAGGELIFASLGENWAMVHRPSLIGLNSFTEKELSPEIWDQWVLPVVSSSSALVFTVAALVFFFASIRLSGGRRKRGTFGRIGRR